MVLGRYLVVGYLDPWEKIRPKQAPKNPELSITWSFIGAGGYMARGIGFYESQQPCIPKPSPVYGSFHCGSFKREFYNAP